VHRSRGLKEGGLGPERREQPRDARRAPALLRGSASPPAAARMSRAAAGAQQVCAAPVRRCSDTSKHTQHCLKQLLQLL
jgi:hypothetical protein